MIAFAPGLSSDVTSHSRPATVSGATFAPFDEHLDGPGHAAEVQVRSRRTQRLTFTVVV